MPGGFQFGNFEFDLTAFVNDEPQHGIQFAQPLTLTIQYNAAAMTGLDLATLELFYWDGSSWRSDGIQILARDLENATITVLISHLSQFAFFATPVTSDNKLWLPLIQDSDRQVIYTDDFSADAGLGWSMSQRAVAPNGQAFLKEPSATRPSTSSSATCLNTNAPP
ncbi:MAG: hypothetical protein R2856_26730 [Caldilineaceae bacterium]